MSSHRRARRPRWTLVGSALAAGVVASALGYAAWPDRVAEPGPAADQPIVATPAPVPSSSQPAAEASSWTRILDDLDQIRAAAWSEQRPALLARVFAPNSQALRADRRLLAAYAARGLRVDDADLDFVSVRLVGRRRGVARILTVDRLTGPWASDSSGRLIALPRDLPTRHLIMLVRSGSGWRIGAVRVAT